MSSGRTVVAALHLHPVKSCRRVEVAEAVVGPYGLRGDREWQLSTPDGDRITQRQHPALARVQPVPISDGLRLRCEGRPELEVARPESTDAVVRAYGGRISVADAGDDAARWFEDLLGIPCRLVAMAAGYRRRLPEAVDVFGQEVALGDAAPVLVASEASHRYLLDRATEPFGIERFRPNVIVRGAEPWAEDTWRTFTVGPATFRAGLPWPRCSMPQIDQTTGERHREPAVVLKKYRWCAEAPELSAPLRDLVCGNALFGIGCSAGPDGALIRVGDPIEVVEAGGPLLPAPAAV